MLVMQPLLPVQWVKVVSINYRLYKMSIDINIYYTLYKFIGVCVCVSVCVCVCVCVCVDMCVYVIYYSVLFYYPLPHFLFFEYLSFLLSFWVWGGGQPPTLFLWTYTYFPRNGIFCRRVFCRGVFLVRGILSSGYFVAGYFVAEYFVAGYFVVESKLCRKSII